MKKIFYAFSFILLSLLLSGCGEQNIDLSLEEVMEKLYEGIPEDELPMALQNVSLNEENFEYYAFTDVDYKEAIASESMTGSIAHSIVLIRLNNANDTDKVVKEIEEKADPRKWMCVEAEHKYVLSKGDLVVLIMSNEMAPTIKENFEKLK